MSILFANTSRAQGAGSGGHLLEFKAGRTLLEAGSTPDKKKAVADKAKGTLFIKQSNDQLMHFCWRNREKNTTDLDLIIFPGDTEFVRIKECTDGRVYMLKFKSSDEHKLFWMQEPRTDKDDEYCKKVNELLNNPQSSRSRAGADRSNANANAMSALNSAIAGSDDIGALGNMDQTQLMQLFNLMNGGNSDILPQLSLNTNRSGSPAPETPKTRKEPPTASTAAASKFDTNMLSQIISGLPAGSNKRTLQLSNVLTRSNVEKVVKENAELLTPHLPTTSDSEEMKNTVGNPQFQQAADFFSYALQSGQLGPALKHFQLPDRVIKAADSGDFVHFSKELTESFRDKTADKKINEEAQQEETTEEAAKKRKDDDDQMDLD